MFQFDRDELLDIARHPGSYSTAIKAVALAQFADEIERLRITQDYVGKMANRLGVDNPAGVRGERSEVDRVGEGGLAEIERLRAIEARAREFFELCGEVRGGAADYILNGEPS